MALVTVLHLLLLFFVSICLGDVCEENLCKCTMRKGGKRRVDCRSKALTEVFSQEKFPSDMKILDLSKNNISIIRRGFLDQHFKLERLYLQKNSIKLIEERAFVGLDELSRLNVRQNQLSQLNRASFLGLTKLDVLELSYNKIKNIDKLAFLGLKSLTKLVLKKNSFTTIRNGTFDKLPSLKKIDLEGSPLDCDCHLSYLAEYLAKTGAPKVLGTCQGSKEKLMDLKGTNLCEKPPEIFIDPSEDQIVADGDSFDITCSVRSEGRKRTLYWTKNDNQLPKKIKPASVDLKSKTVSFMSFSSISWQDSGTYKCYGSKLTAKEIVIKVITSKLSMCSRDVMKVDQDEFIWPMTVERTTADIPCPWPSKNAKAVDTNIRRTCTEKGVWGPVTYGNCQRVSFSKKLMMLAKLFKKTDFVDVKEVVEKLKKLTSYPSSFQFADDITQVLNVVAGIIQRNVPFNVQLFDDMLASFSNVMDVSEGTLYAAQRRDQAPSRLGARLELISRVVLEKTTSHVQSNIVIGSVDLTKARPRENKTCNVYFESEIDSQPGGFYCEPHKREDYAVSIYIPNTILQSLKAAGHTGLKLQFLVYRNGKLFPNVISNKTEYFMRDRNISSSVLAIQMGDIKELNLTEPLVIRFATQHGTEPITSHFDFGEEVIGRPWSQNTDCMVKDSTVSMTTVECIRLVNKNLAIMSHLVNNNVVVYPVEIVVYLGAVLASLLLIATLVTFAIARTVRFNRDDIIMLMNACLALTIVVLSFAFGIDRTENWIACRVMGIFLHFFFFASLLWLGSYVVCVTRRLMPRTDSEDAVFNPVLMYYMVSWGVPAIVCGMTVAGDIKNYKVSDYCWLTESAGLGAFVGPACLLFIIIAVLLVRLHLLLARGITDQRASTEITDNPEEERLQTDEPGVLEEAPDPNERPNPEKSAVTLYLVATWVVMSLIYLNFILAYFLVNSRTSKLRWAFLSYVYALANIALGAAMFGFHCVARPEVREAWRLTWKVLRGWKINCGPCRTVWFMRRKKDETAQVNGRIILVNGEDITQKIESDRQSNITLPSSAALTNDVFVNGRPMSTARVSLLDEADFPPEESPRAGAVDNEVDITETANGEENRISQNSVQSERKAKTLEENTSIPEESEQNTNLLPVPSETRTETREDSQADITDGVTSKSESSAPTAIEVIGPQAPTGPDSPISNVTRQLPPSNQAVHPSQSVHQFRPIYQAPFTHQVMSAHHGAPVYQGQPALQVPPRLQVPPNHQIPPAHQTQSSVIEPPPPSYLKALEMMSQSGSSIGDSSALSRANFKRKRSNESLGSRNESGSAGPRARKLPQLQVQAFTLSSTISEVPVPVPQPNRLSDTTTPSNVAQSLGASTSNPQNVNRYKDGRVKPEPKQWNRSTQNRIAYVPIPHVSKIHQESLHNETSV